MQDQKKTKAQLIEELQHLRTRLEDADHGENGSATESDIRSDRKDLQAEIKFIGNFGLIQAQGVNLSEGGICFEVGDSIPFEMEFQIEGKMHERRAHLVWMKQLEYGGSQLGFRFVPVASPETSGLLWLYKELKELNELNE